MTKKEFRIQRALGTLKFNWSVTVTLPRDDDSVDVFTVNLNGKKYNVGAPFEGYIYDIKTDTNKSIKKILLDAVEKILI